MALPGSGSLSIKGTAGTCRSICEAVIEGGGSASGSLNSLSTSAGKAGGMRDFYNYLSTPVNLVYWTGVGTPDVSPYVYQYWCVCPTPAAGKSYDLCLCGKLCTRYQCDNSYARLRVTCNGVQIYNCCIVAPTCIVAYLWVPVFTVTAGNTVCLLLQACTQNTAAIGDATSIGAIYSADGDSYKGTTCTCAVLNTG